MLAATCHCKAVHIEVDAPPAAFNACQCSICRRYGALWAYYRPDEVRIAGETEFYCWGDRTLEFHRCRQCGCVTHWAPTDRTETRMAVNGRLFDPADVATVPVRGSPGPA
ncbi:GFA family protein [Aureimonas leprariae]|uniref:CENP-V/GFA domain-containing protein n=1 Tax=Plantimonas leprariae TaxID=2615207 RepID=A0A7V7PT91_9HYPH|nr:hypothetical protein [Aureimonas leprariae]KAB0682895.1 hypothetical protein F6X38_02100 [Aureimonas leprariae]